MEAKGNRKRSADHIKMLAAFKAASADSDSDASVIVSHKKKAILGVLPNQK